MIGYRNYSQSDLRLFKAGAKISNRDYYSVSNLRFLSQGKGYDLVNNIGHPNGVQQKSQRRRRGSISTKINFTYHQPTPPYKSVFVNNKRPQSQTQKIQQIEQQKFKKQKPQKFMNIISKNYLSENVLDFIYGKDKTKQIKEVDHKLGPVVNSIPKDKRETIQRQVINHGKVYDHLPVARFNGLIQSSEQPTFEHFPISKVRKYAKSNRKNSSSDLLFPSNGKNYNEQQNFIQKKDSNQQNQVREIANEDKNAQTYQLSPEPQEWNNTIKFNQRKLNCKHQQLGDTADSNPVHKTEDTEVSLKQPTQEMMRNNQTQKISEFILRDQEMRIEEQENPLKEHQVCHYFTNQDQEVENLNNNNNSNQFVDEVPSPDIANQQPQSAEIEPKAPDIQPSNEDSIDNQKIVANIQQNGQQSQQSQKKENEKILYNIQTSETLGCQKPQQIDYQTQSKFQIYDKLEESIQELGKNIGDLTGRLVQFSQQRNQKQIQKQLPQQVKQVKQVGRKQRKLSLTSKCYSENVTKPIVNTSEIKKEGRINLLLFPEQLTHKQDLKQQIVQEKQDIKQQVVDEEIAINITYQGRHHNHSKAFQFIQQEPVEFIQGQPQNEFLNLTYSRETKILHQREISRNQSPNKVAFIDHEKGLGSLEIIDHKHQHCHSLSHIYINQHPQKELYKSNEGLVTTMQCHYYSQKLYHHLSNISTEQKANNLQPLDNKEFQESMQSIPQEKVQQFLPHLTQNQFNKIQRERRIKEFYGVGVRATQQPKIKKGIERVTKNIRGIQLGKQNYNNNTKLLTKNLAVRPQSIQAGTNNSGLNYEMYRTYRNRSGSKKYTILGYDQKKERRIDLPYMENPLNAKLNEQLLHLPKYIKSKVYYLKG